MHENVQIIFQFGEREKETEKRRKEAKDENVSSLYQQFHQHMSLIHCKWDRLNSKNGPNAETNGRDGRILGNIFTAIKYSGLEDSNKFFFSHVYIVSIFMDQ